MRAEHIPENDDGELMHRLLQIHKRNEGRAMASQHDDEFLPRSSAQRFSWLYSLVIGLMLFGVVRCAFAAVTAEWRVNLLRGSTTIDTPTGAIEAEAWAKCLALIPKTATTSTKYRCQTPVYTATVTPDPVVPPPTTAQLVYAATAAGTYAALDGASVSGSINVRLDGTCPNPPGPWTFYVDGVQANTENLCPYEFNGDNALISLPNGTHRIEVRGSQAVPVATFTVGAVPPPPVGTGTATVRWTPPIANTDGSTLVDLAGYRIAYGTTPADLTQTVQVATPSATSYVVDKLTAGSWYFTVRAYNTAGAESTNANVASKVVAP